ncbi:hypothetical protein L6164_005131 [Bauhinia variegata]|uniref:Uncharacterized protein n=1 Tax=Bauhinia variegata TaxID=167791 RepID=A0ACB9PSX4_BAUVA|nr:hypothetical protein L6164_005131 [Bauhinia variegata]
MQSLTRKQAMSESSAHKMKEQSESEEKAQDMKRDSVSENREKKQDQTVSVSDSQAPQAVPYSSPVTPPSLRNRKSPSPPLHSPSDSPVSDVHEPSPSPTHDKHKPQQKLPIDSSPESSISDDHCCVSDGSPPIGDQEKPASPVVVANRFQVEPKVVTKVDPGAEEGVVGVGDVEEATGGGSGGGGNVKRRLRPDVSNFLRSKKEVNFNKTVLALRMTALVFCLISFSVLAADRKQGWALDSFYAYKEFKYSLSANAIGFLYSLFQVSDLIKYLITRKYIVQHQLRSYLNFSMDQVLTYLLMSASSSAATRAYDWESNWGEDKFEDMANASVALSFVAFTAFALSSLVSGYMLCRFR